MTRPFLAVLLAAVVIGWPRVQAQRQVFSNGNQAELALARSTGVEHLRSRALRKGIRGANDLAVSRVSVDRHSMAHTRVQQYFEGIPVWTGEAIAHLTSAGIPFADTDALVTDVSVNTTPALTAAAAIDIALSNYGCSDCLSARPTADLWILRQDGIDHLAYRVRLTRLRRGGPMALPVRFVDAHSGQVVMAYDNAQSATGRSLYSGDVTIETTRYQGPGGLVYALENLSLRVGTFSLVEGGFPIPGFQLQFNDELDVNDIWDADEQRMGVDAQFGAEWYLRYLSAVHGRNGLDGSGGPGVVPPLGGGPALISQFLHYSSPTATHPYDNSKWLSEDSSTGIVLYGDGGDAWFSPLVDLETVAHELTHGLTQFTAGLVYQGESGALNESWSDVFGAMTERYVWGESANTWKISEQIFTPGIPGDALRYMDEPHRADHAGFDGTLTDDDDVDHYSERYMGTDDEGGVHVNSGIANKAFYLLAQGGTHHLGGSMSGIGADAAARIWFLALTEYMTSGTNFMRARDATMLAAAALYGSDSPQQRAVSSAWCLVGVGCAEVEAVSVTPSSGSGTVQKFTLEYSDTVGAGDLEARVRFGDSDFGPGTCTITYNAMTHLVQLLDDTGTSWTAATTESGAPLSNSQCVMNAADVSATVSPSGTNLTMAIDIEFTPTFTAPKNIYMAAASLSTSNVDTGWILRGTWTPSTLAVVSATAVTPNAGEGASRAFTLLYSDTLGAIDLKSARMRIATSSTAAASSCTASYNATTGDVQLQDDGGGTWMSGRMGTGSLSNSQCTLNLTRSSATPNGTSLTVTLDITFATTFTGPKNIYMLAASATTTAANTGWRQRGTWLPYPGPVDLDTIDTAPVGHSSRARAINASGQVVGHLTTLIDGIFQNRAFLWTQAAGMRQLGTLGGAYSLATAISDSGRVVGYSARAGAAGHHAFSWTEAGRMVDLGTLGGTSSEAFAVNDSGQVVGRSQVAGDNEYHAFSWTASGGMVDLGTLGGPTDAAFGVNASGRVAGRGTFALPMGQSIVRPFTWTQSGGMVQLTSDNFGGEAVGVNDLGEVVGFRQLLVEGFVKERAFLWSAAGGMEDLGALGDFSTRSFATAVSQNGQVVGYSDVIGGGGIYHAFLWTRNGGIVDLGAFGGNTSFATAVNGHGQVVGWSMRASGLMRAFLWTRVSGMIDLGTVGGNQSSAADLNDCQAIGYSNPPANTSVHATLWKLSDCPQDVRVDAISVSPTGGSGMRQTFSLRYFDSLGGTDLSVARVRFGASNVAPNSCTIDYDATTGLVRIQRNDGSWLPGIPIGSGSLENDQCRLNQSSTATPEDKDLTLLLDITFKPAFAGADPRTGLKNIYMLARSTGGTSSDWLLRGSWTIPPVVLTTVSVSPQRGSGFSQIFTLQYSDSAGARDITSALVRFVNTDPGAAPGTCVARYMPATAMFGLRDAAGQWTDSAIGSGTLSNGRCTLYLATSSATVIDNSLTLTLDIAFARAFSGIKNIDLRVDGSNGSSTGWEHKSADWLFTVPTNSAALNVQAVTPAAGEGSTQVFTLNYWDSLGAVDLTRAGVSFTGIPPGEANDAAPRSCTIAYNASTGMVRLQDDDGNWLPAIAIGSSSLQNGQCRLNNSASNATTRGTGLTMTLSITFNPTFAGLKNTYMLARSATGTRTGWRMMGTWTGTEAAVVEALSVVPNARQGSQQRFALQYSDTRGATDLSARVRFSTVSTETGTCTARYDAASGTVQILNNAGTVWSSPSVLGSGQSLSNRQCTINVAASSATASGSNLLLVLDITFTPTFAGVANIDLRAASLSTAANTGWVRRGMWTVPQ